MHKPWHTNGMSPTKDKRMAMTEDNFYRIIAMHDEVIFEQRDTIAKLKMTINKLRLKKGKTMPDSRTCNTRKPHIYFKRGWWRVTPKPRPYYRHDLPWGNAYRFIQYLNHKQGVGHA